MMPNLCIQDSATLISFQPIEHVTCEGWPGLFRLEQNIVHLWGIELDRTPRCLEQ